MFNYTPIAELLSSDKQTVIFFTGLLMSTIGQRIKEVRQELRLSQKQFGQIFNAGKSYISSVENDKSKLSVDNLVKLLLNYNVSVDYILGGIGKPFLSMQSNFLNDNFRANVLTVLKEQGLI